MGIEEEIISDYPGLPVAPGNPAGTNGTSSELTGTRGASE